MILTQMKGLLVIWQKEGNITGLFNFLTIGTFLLVTVIGGTACLPVAPPNIVIQCMHVYHTSMGKSKKKKQVQGGMPKKDWNKVHSPRIICNALLHPYLTLMYNTVVADFKAVMVTFSYSYFKMLCCWTVMVTLTYRNFRMVCCWVTHQSEVGM